MLFTSVYGHVNVKRQLTSLFHSKDQTGTYLFHGPLCVGKRTVAFDMARYLLCIREPADDCNCESCRLFPFEHPDFITIGTNEKIKVADVDKLLAFSEVVPFISPKKVAVIDNAEDMTWEASNRLLKLLEEPPEGFSFFVVTAEPDKIIDTVRSRCIRYNFGNLSQEDTINVLFQRMGYDLPKARILGWIASGSSVDIFSKAGLYLKYREMALDFVFGFRTRRLIEVLDFIDKVVWKEVPVFVDMIVLIMTDLLLLKNNIEDIVNSDVREQLLKNSEKFNEKALVSAANLFEQVKKNQHLNVNLNLAMKTATLKAYPLFSV